MSRIIQIFAKLTDNAPYNHYYIQLAENEYVEHLPDGCEYMIGEMLFPKDCVKEVEPENCIAGSTFQTLVLQGVLKEVKVPSANDHVENGVETTVVYTLK